MFSKILNIIRITAIILWLPVFLLLISIAYNRLNSDIGFKPNQPVKFSHKVHTGDYKIKCLFCHHTSERNSHSLIPSTQSCMICHVALRAETDAMKPVNESHDKKKPIQWIRINKLAEFTHYNHSSHINAGIDCSSCHGEVEKMEVVFKDRDFTMRWCLDCHRSPEKYINLPRPITGIFDYNRENILNFKIIETHSKPLTVPFYGEYFTGNMYSKYNIATAKIPGKGPENCSACHY